MNQFLILEFLKKNPSKWFTNKEIAKKTNLLTVSQLTSKLVTDGFILKKSEPLVNKRWFKYKKRKKLIDQV